MVPFDSKCPLCHSLHKASACPAFCRLTPNPTNESAAVMIHASHGSDQLIAFSVSALSREGTRSPHIITAVPALISLPANLLYGQLSRPYFSDKKIKFIAASLFCKGNHSSLIEDGTGTQFGVNCGDICISGSHNEYSAPFVGKIKYQSY